jgi:hypothetical protein
LLRADGARKGARWPRWPALGTECARQAEVVALQGCNVGTLLWNHQQNLSAPLGTADLTLHGWWRAGWTPLSDAVRANSGRGMAASTGRSHQNGAPERTNDAQRCATMSCWFQRAAVARVELAATARGRGCMETAVGGMRVQRFARRRQSRHTQCATGRLLRAAVEAPTKKAASPRFGSLVSPVAVVAMSCERVVSSLAISAGFGRHHYDASCPSAFAVPQ